MEMCENTIAEEGNGKTSHELHFPRKNSKPCLKIEYELRTYG